MLKKPDNTFSVLNEKPQEFFSLIPQAGVTHLLIDELPTHNAVWDMVISPEGRVFFSACGESYVAEYARLYEYDFKTKKLIHHFDLEKKILLREECLRTSKFHTALSFMEDGRIIATTHTTSPSPNHPTWMPYEYANHQWEGFPGSEIVIYDPKTGVVENKGIISPFDTTYGGTYCPRQATISAQPGCAVQAMFIMCTQAKRDASVRFQILRQAELSSVLMVTFTALHIQENSSDTTALKNKTKNENGGAVIWGGIRDTEQMKKVEDTQVYYRGIDPTPIRDFIITDYNTPTKIGNAICLPGDVVFGAGGGVLFIPAHLVEEVVGGAAKTQVKDMFGFEMISQNKFTTAQIDRNTWTKEMLDLLLDWIEKDERATAYRGLDWSLEYDLAINGDLNDTQSAL